MVYASIRIRLYRVGFMVMKETNDNLIYMSFIWKSIWKLLAWLKIFAAFFTEPNANHASVREDLSLNLWHNPFQCISIDDMMGVGSWLFSSTTIDFVRHLILSVHQFIRFSDRLWQFSHSIVCARVYLHLCIHQLYIVH